MNRILIWPNLQLEQPAARVEVINEATVGPLFDELAATMYHAKGIGIAAPQVGLPLRLVVIDVDGERLDMVNPEVVEVLGRQAESREGMGRGAERSAARARLRASHPRRPVRRALRAAGAGQGDDVMGKRMQREHANAEAAAERWNSTFPEGTPVEVRRDNGDMVQTKTRSKAWNLCGTAVVMVDGISGGYSLDRVRPAPQDAKASP